MALLDRITKLFQSEDPPKVRFNELASSESRFTYKNQITPYNPDTLVGRKGMLNSIVTGKQFCNSV